MKLFRWLVAGLMLLGSAAFAQNTYYQSRASFESALGASITDDYERTGYGVASFSGVSDAVMSAVVGETRYTSLRYANLNLVGSGPGSSHWYCAGCSGTFRLTFTSTSVGSSLGVYGAAFDVLANYGEAQIGASAFDAKVTFGDGGFEMRALPVQYFLEGTSFFGLTSTRQIASIEIVGLQAGGFDQFMIDNLTIGSPVPEPSTWALFALGLCGVGVMRRRRKATGR